MNIIGMFLIVMIILIIFRTLKINFKSKRKNKLITNKHMIINNAFKFIKKEFVLLIYIYIGLVGMYVLIERMFKYNIYPANLKNVNQVLSIIHNIDTNQFISQMYLLILSCYIMFILPYKLIKFYNNTIINTNNKDYMHSFIIDNFNKLENKIKNKKNQ